MICPGFGLVICENTCPGFGLSFGFHGVHPYQKNICSHPPPPPPRGHIASSFITDNLKIHERTTLPYSVQSFYYIYTKLDNKKKERNRVDKCRSKYKKKRRGFMDIHQRKLLLPLNLNRCTCKMVVNHTSP